MSRPNDRNGIMNRLDRGRLRYACYGLCLSLLLFPFAPTLAVEPVLDLHGFNLETSATEIRGWLKRQGFAPTTTKTPRSEAYLNNNPMAGQGIGFAPASEGLDVLFMNQNGITTPVDEVIARIEAAYGPPRERVPTERGYRLTYRLAPPSKPGQMVWAVQRRFVGVELTSDDYLAGRPAGGGLADKALALLKQWRLPLLYTVAGGIGLLLLFRALPARSRKFITHVLGAVLYPLVSVLEFLSSRLFVLIFGILLIPLFVFSGCAAFVGAIEQGTSWLWVIPWVIGVILVLEGQDEGEFKYTILAELIFLATAAGVVLQMSLG